MRLLNELHKSSMTVYELANKWIHLLSMKRSILENKKG